METTGGDVTSLVLLVLLTETVVVSPAHSRPLGPREAGEPSNAPGPTPSAPLRGSSLSPWRWLHISGYISTVTQI